MIKITKDKKDMFRVAIYAKNGNEIAHSSKGIKSLYLTEKIIEILRSGEWTSHIETANITIDGDACYFTISSNGETILVSTIYSAHCASNPRNIMFRAERSARKGIDCIIKYCDKVEYLF